MTTPRTKEPTSKSRAALERNLIVRFAQIFWSYATEMSKLTKEHGISLAQHNVLSILRGAGGGDLPSGVVAERLINKEPDITRLLDRMEKLGLITRTRDHTDRRVVMTRITDRGLQVLIALDEPLRALHFGQFKHLSTEKLEALADLLQELQERPT